MSLNTSAWFLGNIFLQKSYIIVLNIVLISVVLYSCVTVRENGISKIVSICAKEQLDFLMGMFPVVQGK